VAGGEQAASADAGAMACHGGCYTCRSLTSISTRPAARYGAQAASLPHALGIRRRAGAVKRSTKAALLNMRAHTGLT